jgi:hypothetical protein
LVSIVSKVAIYLFVSVILVFSFIKPVHAQTSSYSELQSAYMFNFAKYIKWPGEVNVFVIGIYGKTDFFDTWRNTLQAKKIGGREISVREFGTMEELKGCHIVYIPTTESKKLAEIRTATAGKNILIVTEDDLIKKGAAISFVVEDDRLRFKIKKSLLSEAGLTAAEGLLKLAIEL